MLVKGAIIVVSIASTTPATEIRRLDERVSDAGRARDTVVLPPFEEPTWLAEARNRLDELGRLSDDWGGSEKPGDRARELAFSLVERMGRHGHRALRIAPMADGGVAVRYLEGARSARFDIYNEGEIVVATREGSDARQEYRELSEAHAVDELSQFLQYEDATAVG